MKLHDPEKKNGQRAYSRSDARSLRRQAMHSGIPAFALRLAAARNLNLAETETTVRHRHD